MTFNPEKYIGRSPALYANKILKECGIKTPPVCEKRIADFLKIPILEFCQADIDRFTRGNQAQANQIAKKLHHTCAWLSTDSKGQSHIRLFGDMIEERKRLSVFHEIGHYILPWHTDLDYIDPIAALDAPRKNIIEKEAFACSSSFLMPVHTFIDDVLSMEISIKTILGLKHRYLTSMEATGIWYAYINPRPCAIMMVEPFNHRTTSNTTNSFRNQHQHEFEFEIPLSFKPNNDPNYPLQVIYFVASKSFNKFLPKGRGINENNIIHSSWTNKTVLKGELHSSSYSSCTPYTFHAECYPYRQTENVLVLLWLDDNQYKLNLN